MGDDGDGRDRDPAEIARRHFELDARAERSTGRLRLVAAVVVLGGSLWIVALGPELVGWVLVIGAWLSVLGWVAVWRRGRHRLAQAGRWYLALEPDGLHMAQGGEPTVVPWARVTASEVDEERLVVRVHRNDGDPLDVPPVWRGIGLHELRDAIEEVRLSPGAPAASARPPGAG